MELGYQSTSISDCAQEIWDYGQRGEMKPLHESFKTLREMNDYIAFEGALRTYCDLMKDSPTQYEQLLGLTRIGELTFEECKDQLIQLEWITEALSYVRYDPERSSRWTYEPGVTYRINGKIYNDPFGLDYKNGPSDVFGDGR
jgi:hypothetical protein